MSNTSGFSAAKPKRKRCMLKQKLRLEGSRSLQILRRFSVLFVGKFTTRSGSSERGANIGRMRTDGGYYFYIHVHTNQLWLMFNMYVHCLFLAHYYQPIISIILSQFAHMVYGQLTYEIYFCFNKLLCQMCMRVLQSFVALISFNA